MTRTWPVGNGAFTDGFARARVTRLRLIAAFAIGCALAAANCASSARGPTNIEAATAVIEAHLPSGWTLAAREDGQLPRGHYWGDWGRDYAGPRGRHLVVVGPQPVAMAWRADDGSSHKDPIARESLEIWIMPGNYREGFWSRINLHAPEPPPEVFAGERVKVFAMPSHALVDRVRFKNTLADANEMDWPDSPARTGKLSWATWRTTLAGALAAGS